MKKINVFWSGFLTQIFGSTQKKPIHLAKNNTVQFYFILDRARVYLNFLLSSMPKDCSDIHRLYNGKWS